MVEERIVVDTDVISFVFKGHSLAAAYASDLDGKQLVVSFMTVAELKRCWLRACPMARPMIDVLYRLQSDRT